MLILIIQILTVISIYEFIKFVIDKIRHTDTTKKMIEMPKPEFDLFFKEYSVIIDLMNKNQDADIKLMLYNEFAALHELKKPRDFEGLGIKLD